MAITNAARTGFRFLTGRCQRQLQCQVQPQPRPYGQQLARRKTSAAINTSGNPSARSASRDASRRRRAAGSILVW